MGNLGRHWNEACLTVLPTGGESASRRSTMFNDISSRTNSLFLSSIILFYCTACSVTSTDAPAGNKQTSLEVSRIAGRSDIQSKPSFSGGRSDLSISQSFFWESLKSSHFTDSITCLFSASEGQRTKISCNPQDNKNTGVTAPQRAFVDRLIQENLQICIRFPQSLSETLLNADTPVESDLVVVALDENNTVCPVYLPPGERLPSDINEPYGKFLKNIVVRVKFSSDPSPWKNNPNSGIFLKGPIIAEQL